MTHKEISSLISRAEAHLSAIRDFVNTPRYQYKLISHLPTWNRICSSLDTIEDDMYAISDYMKSPYPKRIGRQYITTYGLLQVLYVQQDALKTLSSSFQAEDQESTVFRGIRDIRNSAIGHPTSISNRNKSGTTMISRISLRKSGFTMLESIDGRPEDRFIEIDIPRLITDQLTEANRLLAAIGAKLMEQDRSHKDQFSQTRLSDLIPPTLSYFFEKVAEAISNPHGTTLDFGLRMLESISKRFREFSSELEKRDELQGRDYLQYDLETFNRSLTYLNNYLTAPLEPQEHDARIYFYYARQHHEYFLKIASEIDDDYSK